MTTYVALLRGINVGGHNKVAMADLRRLFVDLGHGDVRTHIQSGNVVFSSRLGEARLRSTIEDALATTIGVPAKVAIRSARQLAAVVDGNPFLGPDVDPASLYVGFLVDAPDASVVAGLKPPAQGDTYRVVGREVFLSYPGGYGRTKLTGASLEKSLGVPVTVRNWRVVGTLAELAAA
jgi:uncharacterized protein (DUF1697 family)